VQPKQLFTGTELTYSLPIDEPLGIRLSASNVVLDLKPGMAAATAGVQIYDVVHSVDGTKIDYEYAALDLLKKKPDGSTVRKVVVWRQNSTAAAPAPSSA